MITKFVFQGGKISNVEHGKKSSGISIIDVYNPTQSEINSFAKESGLSSGYITDSLDEDERPRIHDFGRFSKIVYRAPIIGNKTTNVFSFSLIFSNKAVYILRRRPLHSFQTFLDLEEERRIEILMKGTSFFTFWLLDHITNTYLSLIEPLENNIEKIESEVFASPKKSTVKKIFLVKKTLIYFHRAFSANREAITSIEKGYLRHIHRDHLSLFRDIYNDLTQLIDIEATLREILTGSLEIYLSSVSNNLNEIMKKLTVYASFILVPTFIAGVYGMNFHFMPEIAWQLGYPFSILVMLVSVLLMYFSFRRKGWI